MSLFAISDTHLSFGSDKSMEVFVGWENYTSRLQTKWNSVVGTDDYVVIGGDVSWAMNFDELIKDFDFINSLNGKKFIVKGNHDYWWNTKTKMDKFIAENHFDTISIIHNNSFLVGNVAICGSRGWFADSESEDDIKVLNREIGRIKASIEWGKTLCENQILFLHYPPVTQSCDCTEILNLLEEYNISRCYYGHLHSNAAKSSINEIINKTKFALISADYLGFCPLLIEKF